MWNMIGDLEFIIIAFKPTVVEQSCGSRFSSYIYDLTIFEQLTKFLKADVISLLLSGP